jgi:hypothetical protein
LDQQLKPFDLHSKYATQRFSQLSLCLISITTAPFGQHLQYGALGNPGSHFWLLFKGIKRMARLLVEQATGCL